MPMVTVTKIMRMQRCQSYRSRTGQPSAHWLWTTQSMNVRLRTAKWVKPLYWSLFLESRARVCHFSKFSLLYLSANHMLILAAFSSALHSLVWTGTGRVGGEGIMPSGRVMVGQSGACMQAGPNMDRGGAPFSFGGRCRNTCGFWDTQPTSELVPVVMQRPDHVDSYFVTCSLLTPSASLVYRA